jgi:ParB family chromosome partitioning protein
MESARTTKTGLGKGLSALLGDDAMMAVGQGFIPALDIDAIKPNPYQPRVEMDPQELVDLADSIREHGVIEPLIVTKKNDTDYELIAGERRLRASKLAGVKTVPVVVKEASPQQMLELAVVENVQRSDLNALEEAMAFDQLAKLFDLTHEDIAHKVGLSRPAVANKIRLLSLPEEIKRGLLERKITEGHARGMLGLDSRETMIATYKVILRDGLSVRATEELVRRLNKGQKRKHRKNSRLVDERTTQIEGQLKEIYGSVSLMRSARGGRIVIKFDTEEELDKLMSKLI